MDKDKNRSSSPRNRKPNNPLTIVIQRGAIDFGDSLSLLIEIDNLYKALGGDGLTINSVESKTIYEVPGSEFDPLKGTPFENVQRRVESSMLEEYVARKEVYEAIDRLGKQESRIQVKQAIDRKYPTSIWGDKFPHDASIWFLFNERREDFK